MRTVMRAQSLTLSSQGQAFLTISQLALDVLRIKKLSDPLTLVAHNNDTDNSAIEVARSDGPEVASISFAADKG